jgi:membrane associated rhomboid family serine protease
LFPTLLVAIASVLVAVAELTIAVIELIITVIGFIVSNITSTTKSGVLAAYVRHHFHWHLLSVTTIMPSCPTQPVDLPYPYPFSYTYSAYR